MYKKIVVGILVTALLNLYGCYTYSTLTKEEIENKPLTAEDAFVFVLKDGSEIDCDLENNPQANFVRVDEPSDFIFGNGLIYSNETREQTKLLGKISSISIDSTKTIKSGNDVYTFFWLKDSTRVTYKDGDYINILPQDGTGYWVFGKRGNNIFRGKIEFVDISEIQEKKDNEGVNMVIILIGIGVFAILAAGYAIGSAGAAALGD